MSNDRDPMAGDAGIARTIDWYVESFPRVAMKFLGRMLSESGFGSGERYVACDTVLNFYGRPGHTPCSGWRSALLNMLDRSDIRNLARAALAFHDEALCVWICKNMKDGTDLLEEALRIAEKIDTPAARRLLGTPPKPMHEYPSLGERALADQAAEDQPPFARLFEQERQSAGAHSMEDREPAPGNPNLHAELVKGQEWAEEPCEDESPHLSHVYPFGGTSTSARGQ